MTDREAAWEELHAATPPGWYVGRPSYHDERNEWLMYAFDPSERAVMGRRSREWTAMALTEEAVIIEVAPLPPADRRREGAEVIRNSVIARVAFMFVLAACNTAGTAEATPRTVEGLDIAFARAEAVPPQAITVDTAVQALRARGAVFERPPDVAEYGMAACAVDPACLNGGLRDGPRSVWLIEWEELGTGEPWGKFVVDPQAGHVLGAIGEWPRD